MESSLMVVVFFLRTGSQDEDYNELVLCMGAYSDAKIMQIGVEELFPVVYDYEGSYLDSYFHHRWEAN